MDTLPIGILRRNNMRKRYPYVKVNIYENNAYPVVSHIFYGKTAKEAYGYFQSHMKTDEFLRAAILYQKYKGMLLVVEMKYG